MEKTYVWSDGRTVRGGQFESLAEACQNLLGQNSPKNFSDLWEHELEWFGAQKSEKSDIALGEAGQVEYSSVRVCGYPNGNTIKYDCDGKAVRIMEYDGDSDDWYCAVVSRLDLD